MPLPCAWQVGEESKCAEGSTTVDLNSLFEGLRFDAVEEAALAAGQKYSQARPASVLAALMSRTLSLHAATLPMQWLRRCGHPC